MTVFLTNPKTMNNNEYLIGLVDYRSPVRNEAHVGLSIAKHFTEVPILRGCMATSVGVMERNV